MFNISLAHGFSLTTMLAVAAVAIVLSGVFYRRAFGTLKTSQWLTLLSLRIAAIVLIVLLLFRPVLSYYRTLQERPTLVMLLDASSSMSISDDASGVTRFSQARARIEEWWERLQHDFDRQLIVFSESARPLEGIEQLAVLVPDGKATSLSRALELAAAKLSGRDGDAVIMFSDGIHNSAGDPLKSARKKGMVVHTVGVGASLRGDASYRDIQVTGIECPDRLMLNNMAKITASVEGIALPGRVIEVFLDEDDRQIGQAELTLDDVEGSQQVGFDFRPELKGRHTYKVHAAAAAEERIKENNQRSAVAMVVEPGIRVLYIEGTLRGEYGALVGRFLAKDPDLEFCALVQTRPNVFTMRSNIAGLELDGIPTDQQTINKFDVFIIGDLDASYIRGPQQELLAARIRDGAGLVMLGGYHSLGPGGYAGTPLGKILPVQLGSREVGQITEPFLPVLTPDGVRHPIFANISGFFPTQQAEARVPGLPTLDGCTRVEGARPAATVLATFAADRGSGIGGRESGNERKPDSRLSMPVLAVQPVGRGRTAVFCGDTTRRWQQGPRAMDRESPFLRFWGQMVRWLAGRSEELQAGAGITADTDKVHYEPGQPIRISAVVRGSQGEGAAEAKVVAKIRDPDGRPGSVPLAPVPGPAGHYSGAFEPQTAGTYEIVVESRVGQLTISTDKMAVEVGRPRLEFEKLDLDEKMLGQIASKSTGYYVHITTAGELVERFDRTKQKRRDYNEIRLWWPLPFWVLFVGVLTAEWILRKRYQLR